MTTAHRPSATTNPRLLTDRPGLLIIAGKGYVSAELDHFRTERGIRLIRPSYRNRPTHHRSLTAYHHKPSYASIV